MLYNIGFDQNRCGIVAKTTLVLPKTDVVMHYTVSILTKPMLYSALQHRFWHNRCYIVHYNIGSGENRCRLWISTSFFITGVKIDLLLTIVVSTLVQNWYWMSSRIDVNDLFSSSVYLFDQKELTIENEFYVSSSNIY